MIQIMRLLFMLSNSVLALGLLVALTASAEPISFQCPARYLGERHVIDRAPAGWDGFVSIEKGSLLRAAGAYTAEAKDQFELRGADLPRGAGREFRFEGTDDDGEKFVYCGYGDGADIRLVRRLPVAVKRCEISEQRSRQRLVAAMIRCE